MLIIHVSPLVSFVNLKIQESATPSQRRRLFMIPRRAEAEKFRTVARLRTEKICLIGVNWRTTSVLLNRFCNFPDLLPKFNPG